MAVTGRARQRSLGSGSQEPAPTSALARAVPIAARADEYDGHMRDRAGYGEQRPRKRAPDRQKPQRATLPPTALVMGAVASVQLGSALAKHLFYALGPGGAAFLRLAFGALVLLAAVRPRPGGQNRAGYRVAILFGLTVAAMNFSFYSALDRIPLGIAVTLEFVGPLGVAVAGSRKALDVLWVVLAAGGIVLLTPWGGLRLDPLGVVFALLAGIFWSMYIILSARVGRTFTGGSGLAIALSAGGLALLPVGIVSAQTALLDPRLLALGAGVGLLSSVIPYSLELEALRHLPTRVFGVLMSTEPAVAAIVGLVFLGQVLRVRAVIAIVLVTAAAVGALQQGERVT